jgi:hypothetical protein
LSILSILSKELERQTSKDRVARMRQDEQDDKDVPDDQSRARAD